jgi:hypothetical protein
MGSAIRSLARSAGISPDDSAPDTTLFATQSATPILTTLSSASRLHWIPRRIRQRPFPRFPKKWLHARRCPCLHCSRKSHDLPRAGIPRERLFQRYPTARLEQEQSFSGILSMYMIPLRRDRFNNTAGLPGPFLKSLPGERRGKGRTGFT